MNISTLKQKIIVGLKNWLNKIEAEEKKFRKIEPSITWGDFFLDDLLKFIFLIATILSLLLALIICLFAGFINYWTVFKVSFSLLTFIYFLFKIFQIFTHYTLAKKWQVPIWHITYAFTYFNLAKAGDIMLWTAEEFNSWFLGQIEEKQESSPE